jgi:hypothetical protein
MRTSFGVTCCVWGLWLSVAAMAAVGDPEGWSLRTNYAKPRAFLVWAPMEDGSRGLVFDCVPGNFFGVRSEDAPEDLVGKAATLLLGAVEARYPIAGEVAKDANTGEVFFTATLPGDAKGLAAVRRGLVPILESGGSLKYAIIAGNVSTGSFENSPLILLQQLRPLMKRFDSACFGAKK